MAGFTDIQILRGVAEKVQAKIKDTNNPTPLKDGQPLYDTTNNVLYVGRGETPVATTVWLTKNNGGKQFKLLPANEIDPENKCYYAAAGSGGTESPFAVYYCLDKNNNNTAHNIWDEFSNIHSGETGVGSISVKQGTTNSQSKMKLCKISASDFEGLTTKDPNTIYLVVSGSNS